jgi:hypothetical protein
MAGGAARTFLVETYVPGLDERAAIALSSSLRRAIGRLGEEGVVLGWGGSFALVDDETYICVVCAPDVDCVRRLGERAGFEHEHIVEAFAIDPPATLRCWASPL